MWPGVGEPTLAAVWLGALPEGIRKLLWFNAGLKLTGFTMDQINFTGSSFRASSAFDFMLVRRRSLGMDVAISGPGHGG